VKGKKYKESSITKKVTSTVLLSYLLFEPFFVHEHRTWDAYVFLCLPFFMHRHFGILSVKKNVSE